MGSNSIPPKTLSDESINRGLVCAHMHFIARTRRIVTFMSLTGECRQQIHTQHAPSVKTECDYLNGWIKKWSHTQKSHPKMVNTRDITGERRKKTPKTGDGKIGTPVATQPDVWHCRVSAGTGRSGVSFLWLGEIKRLMFS